jgi:hypothetical protein
MSDSDLGWNRCSRVDEDAMIRCRGSWKLKEDEDNIDIDTGVDHDGIDSYPPIALNESNSNRGEGEDEGGIRGRDVCG